MDALIASHKKEYETNPEIIVSAPGIINLLGEHTDYNEGYVIQAAIDRSVHIAVSKRSDNSIRFFSADLDERKRTTVTNIKYKREDRWANYIKGALFQIQQSGFKLTGLDISFMGDIPQNIGLGSSSAIGIATAVAVKNIFDFNLSDIQIIKNTVLSENMFIGLDTEITDPFISLVARKGECVFLDLRTLDYSFLPLEYEGVKMVITNSNVPRVSVEEEIRERKSECEKCVAYLRKKKQGTSLRDYTAQDLQHGIDFVPESIRRLCMHVVQENEMVVSAKNVLSRSDIAAFGKIMNRSHESLRDQYEVSCPEIDWLVKRALEIEGVLGSRMTGNGFGGCTVSLMSDDALKIYLDRLGEYDHIFGFTPEYYIFKPADGVNVIYPQR